jgi:hypothetical protein
MFPEFNQVISEEIDTTQLVFMKESEIEALQKENKILEEKLANSSSTVRICIRRSSIFSGDFVLIRS